MKGHALMSRHEHCILIFKIIYIFHSIIYVIVLAVYYIYLLFAHVQALLQYEIDKRMMTNVVSLSHHDMCGLGLKQWGFHKLNV